MIVGRQPVRTGARNVAPWLRAIVVLPGEDVMQPQRHHVIDTCLPGGEHHRFDRLDELFGEPASGHEKRTREGQPDPLVRNLGGTEGWIPRKPAESVPVSLGEDISAPVLILADIGDSGDDRTRHTGDQRTRTVTIRVRIQEFLPHRREEDRMVSLPEVLLGYLQLRSERGTAHGTEQRAVRLPGLEIDRAILDLNGDIVGEFAVEGHEFVVSLHRPIRASGAIDKSAPHNYAPVVHKSICKHICAVHMGTSEVLGARLAFTRGLDKETSEVGDKSVDFVCLVVPPFLHRLVQRIGCR